MSATQQPQMTLIDSVIQAAAKKKEGGKSNSLKKFIRLYFLNVALTDLAGCSTDELCCSALSVWRLCQQRTPSEVRIRIFNPDRRKDGWESSHTIIEIINDDMPFLVDSITMELNRHELTVHNIIHPVFEVERTKTGKLSGIYGLEDDGDKTTRESFMYIEIDQQSAPDFLKRLQDGLTSVLEDVRLSVEDWVPMRSRMNAIIEDLNQSPPPLQAHRVAEGIAFLQWLLDDNFSFLGYCEYSFVEEKGKEYMRPVSESGLGILRKIMPEAIAYSEQALRPEIRHFAHKRALLIITKTNARATVHRAAHMEHVGIRVFDMDGNAVGEMRFHGLYTSTAYSGSSREIPILRDKVTATLEKASFLPDSHSGKALLHTLETYPRDELFQISKSDLYRISVGIVALQERRRVALFTRHDVFQRFVSCLVYLPRDIFNTELCERIKKTLEESYKGEMTNYYTQVDDSALARLLFIIRSTPGKASKVNDIDVEQRLIAIARSWEEDLREALNQSSGEEKGLSLLREYEKAFPPSYREHFSANTAVDDIEKISSVLKTGGLGLNLYRQEGEADNKLRFKIYHPSKPVPLSDALPMLENMGFRVISEVPFQITLKGAEPVFIHDFRVVMQDGTAILLKNVKDNFEEAFQQVWKNHIEDDVFNRLVLVAGLTSREVVILRSLHKFLRQIGTPFSLAYMGETLANNAHIARMLVELFVALFDPKNRKRAEARIVKLRNEIEEALDRVPNLDQDRILRRFQNLIESTLRTNYFQRNGKGKLKTYVSFKFASQCIEGLPLPRPMCEIFVYSPRMEGLHLRGGSIARGGIRWSDRREDFRTEILGLMKAQMVKNAIIVPVGAKGGFVIKRPPTEGGREALVAEAVDCYKTLIRGMLDITDNLEGDEATHPLETLCKDGPDPYLVVAADKGTATFSDIANNLSQDYGFWLGDAFASGGSQGYDHKKIGITARGCWESIKRHFREIGIDIQRTDFSVVGVGDMSGDVFGNGMLLSEHIRLLAAFNHTHIFIDPEPDATESFQERKRLFEIPRSTWLDYNTKLISSGGGIFDRSAKSIKLPPKIQKRFGIASTTITPNNLILHLLRAEVDLLWFGGIGTYVKAANENNIDAGDRANDALRIDGRDLRCKVVGEGANLGVTQLGRIEYALAGGRLNTDSIDNSAGVNCSDHEVNIKILLNESVVRKKLTKRQRNILLARMTEEVSSLVLRDNYLHTQAITYFSSQAEDLLDRQAGLIRMLERQGRLDREIEFLPSDDLIEERLKERQGLTRPEIGVLISYAKNWIYSELLNSNLPDDPILVADLKRYFPTPIQKDFGPEIESHRLRREIIATQVTNGMINRMSGATISQLVESTGMPIGDIARAYLITRQVFGFLDMWGHIQKLDNKVDAATQTEMFCDIGRLTEQGTLWFLKNGNRPLVAAEYLEAFKSGVDEFSGALKEILPKEDLAVFRKRKEHYVSAGVPKKLAGEVSATDFLAPAFEVVLEAQNSDQTIQEIGRLYFNNRRCAQL